MAERLLILGGTAEGAALARGAVGLAGLTVVSSLAGRTRVPATLPGETRVGGFGGAPAMAEYLRATGTTLVVDATHPYAAAISHNAAEACAAAAVPRLMLVRAAWTPEPADDWIEVDDADAAAAKVGEVGPGRRRLLVRSNPSSSSTYSVLAWVMSRWANAARARF